MSICTLGNYLMNIYESGKFLMNIYEYPCISSVVQESCKLCANKLIQLHTMFRHQD